MTHLNADGSPNLSADEEAALREVLGRRHGRLGLMEIRIWRAAGRFYLERAANMCHAEGVAHHSKRNLALRTDTGNEIAIAQGHGAFNCETVIRSAKSVLK